MKLQTINRLLLILLPINGIYIGVGLSNGSYAPFNIFACVIAVYVLWDYTKVKP